MRIKTVWLDGQQCDYADASVGPMAHSLSYASSVYEGIRIYKRRMFRLGRHLERLRRSCGIFGHEFPYSDQEIQFACLALLECTGLIDAYVKILVFYDDTDHGFQGIRCRSRVLIVVHEKPGFPHENPWQLSISSWRRPSDKAHPYQAKTSSTYALSFLSFRARPADADDILFLDEQERVCESGGANIFFTKGRRLITPTTRSCLAGVTRDIVLNEIAAALDLEPIERDIARSEIPSFDGAFLTGTAVEIRAVSRIDNYELANALVGCEVQRLFSSIANDDRVFLENSL